MIIIIIVNLETGRRLLLLECQSSIFILGLCDFFDLVLFFCFLVALYPQVSLYKITYCVTIKYLIMRNSAYISNLNTDIIIITISGLLNFILKITLITNQIT